MLLKTLAAGWVGPSTHNGIRTAKKPKTWTIRMTPSMIGSFCARNVLKMKATKATAITYRVPCHGCGSYVSGKLIARTPINMLETV